MIWIQNFPSPKLVAIPRLKNAPPFKSDTTNLFSFSFVSCCNKSEESSLPNYLLIIKKQCKYVFWLVSQNIVFLCINTYLFWCWCTVDSWYILKWQSHHVSSRSKNGQMKFQGLQTRQICISSRQVHCGTSQC